MIPDPFAQYDAAYVLGALDVEDRRAFEEHLRVCLACTDAVRDAAGVPGLLGRLSLEDLPAVDEPVPDRVLPTLLGEVARRRQHVRMAVGLTAACVVAVAGVALGASWPRPASGTHPVPVAMARVAPDPLRAEVSLTQVPWGTRVVLTCRYVGPSYVAGRYVLVVRDRAGHRQEMATWTAVAGRVSTITGATSWTRSDISRVEVRTPGGRPVLVLRG